MMQINNNIKHIKIDSNSTVAPKKFALEEGIKKSKGELILSTDADCRLLKTWVSSMSSSLSEKGGITIGFSRVLAKSFFENYQFYYLTVLLFYCFSVLSFYRFIVFDLLYCCFTELLYSCIAVLCIV